jgi:hypothetical protein
MLPPAPTVRRKFVIRNIPYCGTPTNNSGGFAVHFVGKRTNRRWAAFVLIAKALDDEEEAL